MRPRPSPSVQALSLPPGDAIPNHPRHPALLYRAALPADAPGLAEAWEERFRAHGWQGLWRWGVYSFHHVHSTAHEILGVARGQATLTLGGPQGTAVEVGPGDAVLLPAGTGHRCDRHCGDFLVVGAYPPGQEADLLRAGEGDLSAVRARVAAVPCPETDPVAGADGPLAMHWSD